MKLIAASLLALCARLSIAQNDDSTNLGDKSLPFASVVTGPWFPGDPPYQSLAGTKVYARDGKFHLGNETTASVSPRCRGRGCVRDTVIFVDGDTSKAYLYSSNPNQLYIDPKTFVLSYTRGSGGLPKGAITTGFMRVGDNPRGQTTSPATCDGCGLSQAPAMWTWPLNNYINGFYACPDDATSPKTWTLFQKILYYIDPPNNCTYVQLAALNWRGQRPAVETYN